jgi:hypothetical protein
MKAETKAAQKLSDAEAKHNKVLNEQKKAENDLQLAHESASRARAKSAMAGRAQSRHQG